MIKWEIRRYEINVSFSDVGASSKTKVYYWYTDHTQAYPLAGHVASPNAFDDMHRIRTAPLYCPIASLPPVAGYTRRTSC